MQLDVIGDKRVPQKPSRCHSYPGHKSGHHLQKPTLSAPLLSLLCQAHVNQEGLVKDYQDLRYKI